MSRWFPTAALVAALVLPSLVGCGPPATTSGKASQPATTGSTPPVRPADSGQDTLKTAPHDPG